MEILRNGASVALIYFVDWSFLAVQSLLVGLMGVRQLASQVILSSCYSQLLMAPLGFSIAVSAVTGAAFGQANKQKAFEIMRKTTIITVAMTLVLSTIMLTLRWEIARAFSSDAEVVREAANAFMFAGASLFMEGMNSQMRGVIKGMGQQSYAILITIASYWLIASPLSALGVLEFGKGISYIWEMNALGSGICLVSNAFTVFFTNWNG